MNKIIAIIFLIPFFACNSSYDKKTEYFRKVSSNINFSKDINCVYQKTTGMFYSKGKIESFMGTNDKPLEWDFINMKSKTPEYVSGGDRGKIIKINHTHDDGITLMVPHGTGVHIFTIWPDGISYWSKHTNLLIQGTQSLIGICDNMVNYN